MDLTLWSNKTIRIGYRWGDSGSELLVGKGTDPPTFKLEPKYIHDSANAPVPAQFVLTYATGDMLENWDKLIMTPLGSLAPPIISGLPPWQQSAEKEYEEALNGIINDMYSHVTATERLEGYLPVAGEDPQTLIIDLVRMVYLKNAVTDGGNTKDLVVVVFSYAQAGVVLNQNGGGSGPPN